MRLKFKKKSKTIGWRSSAHPNSYKILDYELKFLLDYLKKNFSVNYEESAKIRGAPPLEYDLNNLINKLE